jgi:hypothetical protein
LGIIRPSRHFAAPQQQRRLGSKADPASTTSLPAKSDEYTALGEALYGRPAPSHGERDCIVCSGFGSVDPTERIDFATSEFRYTPGAELVACPACGGTGRDIANGRMSLAQFIVARLARLYPLHLLTWAATFAVLVHQGVANSDWLLTPAALENITLTPSLFTGTFSFNAPAWSIGAEFWSGILFFALCSRRPRLRAAAIGLALILFAACELRDGFLVQFRERYGICLGLFLLGWCLFKLRPSISPLTGWLAAAAGFALSLFPPFPLQHHALADLPYYVVFATRDRRPRRRPLARHRRQDRGIFRRYFFRRLPLALAVFDGDAPQDAGRARRLPGPGHVDRDDFAPVFRAARAIASAQYRIGLARRPRLSRIARLEPQTGCPTNVCTRRKRTYGHQEKRTLRRSWPPLPLP